MQPTPAQSTNHILLRLDSVEKTFQMGEVAVKALCDVSLDVHEGEMLVIAGPSGSGKSTILNIIGGLDTATAGRVWFRDREMTPVKT
jgi:putative ABC transport system ATP-binding protein